MNDSASQQDQQQKEIIHALLHDRKVDRRWRNLRFFIWVFIILMFAILIFTPRGKKLHSVDTKKPYVALVRLNGIIMSNTSFSARRVIPQLQKAFSDKKAKGVVLVINSPGGSPVQASIIHDKIIALKHQYRKKVVVLGVDTLASGAYLVASAADKIFVNRDTITGSIGVIMSGFGFTSAISKLGITRRVYTAGDDKDRLDPFRPETEADKAKIHKVLAAVHQNFINDVLKSRHKKLHGNQKELFSGDFWTGQQAQKLGLVDGTGNLWNVLKSQFGVNQYKDYTTRMPLLRSLFKDIGTQLHLGLVSSNPQLQAKF